MCIPVNKLPQGRVNTWNRENRENLTNVFCLINASLSAVACVSNKLSSYISSKTIPASYHYLSQVKTICFVKSTDKLCCVTGVTKP